MRLIPPLPVIAEKYKKLNYLKFTSSVFLSFLFLLLSLVTTFFAITYATNNSSYPVTDVILDNIPVFDVDAIFLYGPTIFWIIISLYFILHEPEKIPFALKSIALFFLIRSFFISLTHIGPFPTHISIISTGTLGIFSTGNDLFFSGHTGMPFLAALLLWDNKVMRYFSIIASLFFGAVVLMGHLHYSIDVFAAFFITYGIFHLSEKFFSNPRITLHRTPTRL